MGMGKIDEKVVILLDMDEAQAGNELTTVESMA